MYWCEKMHTASCCRQFQIHVLILVLMRRNQEVNVLLLFRFSSRRARPGLRAGRTVLPELPELGKLVADGTQTRAPAECQC